jgi:hypothetical protein
MVPEIVPAMAVNEMLEFLEIELENNLVSASCEISDGKILITPADSLEWPGLFDGNGNFPDSWYNYETFLHYGWLLADNVENGVYSLIPA